MHRNLMFRRLNQQRHRVGNAASRLQSASFLATARNKAYFRLQRLPESSLQLQRAFSSCGTGGKKAEPAGRTAPQRVVAEDEYYFNEFRHFLALDAPTDDEKSLARSRLVDVVTTTLTKEILGMQATALSLVADKLGDHALVLQVYRVQRENRIQPSPLTLNVAATACAAIAPEDDLDAWETALDVVKQMHEAVHLMPASEEIYHRAIDACSKAHQWLVTLRLVDEMLRYNLPPSPDAWLTVAQTCLANGETDAALSLVDKVRSVEDDVEYDVDNVLESFLVAGAKAHNSAFTVKLLNNLYSHQRARNSRLGGNLSSWFGLKQLHQEPLVLETLSALDQSSIVDSLATDMQWIELDKWLPSLGHPDYKVPREEYGPRNYFGLAKHILESIQAPSAQFVNAYLLTCGRLGKMSEAMSALRAHPRPDLTSYVAAICACTDNADDASQLYDEAIQSAARDRLYEHPRHSHNHVDLVNAYLTSLAKSSKHEDVLTLVPRDLTTEEATNARTMSAVLMAHARLGHWNEVVETFKALKTHGFSCSGFVYGSVIMAYVQLGHCKHAAMLYKHIHHTDPDYVDHPAVLASMFYLFRVDDNDVAAAMALFRSLNFADPTALNADGAVHLLHLLAGMRNDGVWADDDDDSTTVTTRSLLEEVWPVLERMPSLFKNGMGPHSYVVDTALLVSAKAHAIDLAEDIVHWAMDQSIPFSAATYTHMMRVYSQPPLSGERVDWTAPPAYPVRFNYWWDAMQENASVQPNVRTVTSLLAAIRRGILKDVAAKDVLDAMESAWGLPLLVEHCEMCLRIWEAELAWKQGAEAEEVWRQVVDLVRRMKEDEIYFRAETIAAAASCGQAAKGDRIDGVEWLHVLAEAAKDDKDNVRSLVQALQASADVVVVLETYNKKLPNDAIVHALKTCSKDNSSAHMRRLCEWMQRHDVDHTALPSAVTFELKDRLERWGEDVRNDPWRTVLARQ